jgi:hypothetical protein
MKKALIPLFTLILIISLSAFTTSNRDAVKYFDEISDIIHDVNVKEVNYMQAIIYKKRQAKIDHKKDKLVEETNEAIEKLEAMPPFNGDSTLRNTTLDVLKKKFEIMNVELARIDEMEGTAYESYEALEKYYAESNKVVEKVEKEFERLGAAQETFAFQNDFGLSEDNSHLAKQMKNISELNTYIQPLYLAVFRVEKEVAGYYESVMAMDYEKAEVQRKTIIKYSDRSLKVLTKDRGFRGDRYYGSLAASMVRFYQKHAKTTFVKMNGYVKKGKNMSRSDAKQFNEIAKNYQKQYQETYSRYINGYYSFQQKYVSKW